MVSDAMDARGRAHVHSGTSGARSAGLSDGARFTRIRSAHRDENDVDYWIDLAAYCIEAIAVGSFRLAAVKPWSTKKCLNPWAKPLL